MKAYQPGTLNTLDPYKGPSGYGMSSGSFQTIDNVTSITKNQLDPLGYGSSPTVKQTFTYYGLSEDLEMQPRGATGRPGIPGSGAPSSRPSSSGSSTVQGSGSTRTEQIRTARIQAIKSAIPSLPAVPGNVQVNVPEVIVTTPAKPWYKSPLYLALLAAGVFFVAKKYKIV